MEEEDDDENPYTKQNNSDDSDDDYHIDFEVVNKLHWKMKKMATQMSIIQEEQEESGQVEQNFGVSNSNNIESSVMSEGVENPLYNTRVPPHKMKVAEMAPTKADKKQQRRKEVYSKTSGTSV